MKWRKIHLTSEQIENGDLDVIVEKFRIMWLSNTRDFYFQMAMIESERKDDGSRVLYFSPMASAHLDPLFGLYPPEPSGPPPSDAVLVMGDESFRW
jgi:hypothetical protein